LVGALLVLAGLAMIVSVAKAGAPVPFAGIGLVLTVLPIALFAAAGRSVRRDGRRSEEADRLLEILAEVIGAQELEPSGK
jgi:hypothetical protein